VRGLHKTWDEPLAGYFRGTDIARTADNGKRYRSRMTSDERSEWDRRFQARRTSGKVGKEIKAAARFAGLEIVAQLVAVLSLINGSGFDEVRARAADYRLAGKVKQ